MLVQWVLNANQNDLQHTLQHTATHTAIHTATHNEFLATCIKQDIPKNIYPCASLFFFEHISMCIVQEASTTVQRVLDPSKIDVSAHEHAAGKHSQCMSSLLHITNCTVCMFSHPTHVYSTLCRNDLSAHERAADRHSYV